jgi:ribosomal protein S18 acetylase RimI-like enzyme
VPAKAWKLAKAACRSVLTAWENRPVKVRRARTEDAARIAAIHVRSWQVGYQGQIPQDYLDGLDPAAGHIRWAETVQREDMARGGTFVVTDDAGDLAGFAHVDASRDADATASVGEVWAIYLSPDAWGKGLGRELMTATLSYLANVRYTQVTLWVLDSNDRARRFYEAAGFRSDGTVKVDGSRGFALHEVRYARPLP